MQVKRRSAGRRSNGLAAANRQMPQPVSLYRRPDRAKSPCHAQDHGRRRRRPRNILLSLPQRPTPPPTLRCAHDAERSRRHLPYRSVSRAAGRRRPSAARGGPSQCCTSDTRGRPAWTPKTSHCTRPHEIAAGPSCVRRAHAVAMAAHRRPGKRRRAAGGGLDRCTPYAFGLRHRRRQRSEVHGRNACASPGSLPVARAGAWRTTASTCQGRLT